MIFSAILKLYFVYLWKLPFVWERILDYGLACIIHIIRLYSLYFTVRVELRSDFSAQSSTLLLIRVPMVLPSASIRSIFDKVRYGTGFGSMGRRCLVPNSIPCDWLPREDSENARSSFLSHLKVVLHGKVNYPAFSEAHRGKTHKWCVCFSFMVIILVFLLSFFF